jgi:hypothetical protein
MPTLFWAGMHVITTDGKSIPLAQLPLTFHNTLQSPKPGKDYQGGPIVIAGNPSPDATPGEPKDPRQPAIIHVNLQDISAVRLQGQLGGDFPVGDMSRARKLVAQRQVGAEAQFLTVIEPYKSQPMIKSAEATGPDSLHVELADGRMQEIQIHGLAGPAQDISVTIRELKAGKLLRTESTAPADSPTTAPATQ